MERIEYKYVDRSKWPQQEGSWKDEPDKIQWQDEETGLPCLIVRGPSGALCGYVGVDESHPAHGKGYEEVDVAVHGGLTFADRCAESADGRGICHIPTPGEPEHVWWLGFDCAHYGDVCPAYESGLWDGCYKELAYVEHEVRGLARQLKAQARGQH